MQARLLQVLDGKDSEVFRIALEADANALDAEQLRVADANGAAVSAEIRVLDKRKAPNAGKEWVISLALPRNRLLPLTILYRGVPACTIMQEEHDELCMQRDLSMVNPAIDGEYDYWKIVNAEKRHRERSRRILRKPLMSIVTPLFDTPPDFLREMLDSIVSQTYGKWELVLVNATPQNTAMQKVLASYSDPRIKVVELEENLGIASNTNAGIAATTGDYVSFIDHDDLIDKNLLKEFVNYIKAHPQVGVLYCDEDDFETIEDGSFSPMFKPRFNPDLFYTHNYIVHCLTVSRAVLDATERSSAETSGAQDYDLILKAYELGFEIGMVPDVLYHWREHEGSTNGGKEGAKPYADNACIVVLNDHFKRMGFDATLAKTYIPYLYRVHFNATLDEPFTMVVLARDSARLEQLSRTFEKCGGAAMANVIIVARAKDIEDSPDLFTECASCAFVRAEESAWTTVNDAIRSRDANAVLLCFDRVQWTDAEALKELTGYLQRKDVGVVAPRAFFSDELLSHTGLCIDEGGNAHFINQNFAKDMGGGYWGLAECSVDCSAVFADCMMFTREVFDSTEGFEDYDDDVVTAIDFCFQVRSKGLHVVCTPSADVIADLPFACTDDAATERRDAALQKLWEKWGDEWKRDTLWNPNITLTSGYPRLKIDELTSAERANRKLRKLLKRYEDPTALSQR